MSWIHNLEPKLGRFAIPGLIRIVVGFHILTFILLWMNPAFIEFLVLDPGLVLDGQVWRLFTWIFIPRSLSLIWIVFVAMFLLMVGDGLEHAWGTFRLNAYFFAGVILVDLAALILHFTSPATATASAIFGEYLFGSLIMAFAILYPDTEIRLFLIIPVRMKWIGLLTGAFILFEFIGSPPLRIPILVSLVNFFAYALPLAIRQFRVRAQVTARRARFKANQLPEEEAFHRCARCGATDASDPTAEFRVTDNGDELCARCLEKERSGDHRGT